MNPESSPLERRLEMRERQIAAVHEISSALFSKNDLDTLLRETLRVSLNAVEADAGSILMHDRERAALIFRWVVGGDESLIGKSVDPQDTKARAAQVFRTGEPLFTDVGTGGAYTPGADVATGYSTQTMLTVPLKNHGNEVLGVMQMLNKKVGAFNGDDQEVLEIIGSLAATSIINAQLAEEAQLAAVARAVGDLSHDIKNALVPVETSLETLDLWYIKPLMEDVDRLVGEWQVTAPECANAFAGVVEPLRAEFPETRQAVLDGCTDIREMVSEIADYLKGVPGTNMIEGQIGEVVEERLRRLKVVAGQRRVDLHMEAGNVPPFLFDHRLIGRAVYNLVNNALGAIGDAVKKGRLEYGPRYNVWVRVSVEEDETLPGGQCAQIEVRDDGAGVPAHVLPTLFTPNTISTTPGGTGIGTRFVKSVADAHGGSVGAENTTPRGARFYLRLPLQQPGS